MSETGFLRTVDLAECLGVTERHARRVGAELPHTTDARGWRSFAPDVIAAAAEERLARAAKPRRGRPVLLSPEDAARRLGVSTEMVDALRRAGWLRAFSTSAGVGYRRADVERVAGAVDAAVEAMGREP